MIYAIGDIHGQADLLKALYKKILQDIVDSGEADNTIVFLGDYIDRGSQNRQVLEFLMTRQEIPGLSHVMLWGNHEKMFKYAMENPRMQWFVEMWVDNGGMAFMKECYTPDFVFFNETFPWHHYINWMDSHLDYYYETEDYVFVHGGLDVRLTNMAEQDPEVLMWSRKTQKDWYRDFPKLVVHGHTPNSEPVVDMNRINVDTSRYYDRPNGQPQLTAVALHNRRSDGEPRFLRVEKQVEL